MTVLTRGYFAIVGGIGLLTGAVLLAAPDGTADYFAWPIAPAQTVVFMGAGYLGTGITLWVLLVRARSWSEARLIVPPIVVFASTMLAATLLHADRFFWDRPVTWLWTGLYGVIALGALWTTAFERRRGAAPSDGAPLLFVERAALGAAGLLTLAWAAPLFVWPALGSALWPWSLTPLTARVVAGWTSVAATLSLTAALGGDARSVRLPLLGWTITVALFLGASALNVRELAGDARTPVYFGALAISAAGALWLLVRIRGRSPAPT